MNPSIFIMMDVQPVSDQPPLCDECAAVMADSGPMGFYCPNDKCPGRAKSRAWAREQVDREHRSKLHYEWLAQLKPLSWSIHMNDHACCYETAAQEIEQHPENFDDTPPALIEKMKATNTIYRLQIYLRTPVSFNFWFGPTLDSVIMQAMFDLKSLETGSH